MLGLVDPRDSLERQNEKLQRIAEALMRRVEQPQNPASHAYSQFERASLLEAEVRDRTADLERTLDLLHESNARLSDAMAEAEAARANLAGAIETVEEGFALFDAEDRLVLHNSRFCSEMEDVAAALKPGLPFEDYVERVSRSPELELPEGSSAEDWQTRRMRRHSDSRTTFNVRLAFDRWIQVSEQRTSNGGTVILQTDITQTMRLQRRESERLIDRQARMVRATLDHIAQGVVIFDRLGRLMGWNAEMAALLGRSLGDEIVGMDFDDLLDRIGDTFRYTGEVDRKALEAWAARRRPRRPLTFEVERAGGRSFTVFAQEMPDRGFVISFTDVTAERATARALRDMAASLERRVAARTEELGEALEQARRANATKTRFMAAAGHDLLQPLSAAKLFAASLEERAKEAPEREIAGKVVSALHSVETIIDALLDISRLESGRAEFTIGRARLGTILESLRSEMTALAAEKGIVLRVVPCSLVVESDVVLLRRVVQNLVANAIRHSDGTRVLLGVRRAGGRARIEVWDEGPGIPRDQQSVIFEEFRQLAPSRSGANGIGLGLAIVDRACTMLGHELRLVSDAGQGSCFSIAAEVIGDERRAAVPAAPARRGGPPDVLVALLENDEGMARALTLMIEGWGSDVIQADSAEQMLALLAEVDVVPDLFLVDHQLDGAMSGLDFIGVMAAEAPAVPAILISADRASGIAATCAERGVPFLPKPVAPEALAETMRRLVEGGGAPAAVSRR
ncbi:hybrid sensor histidine kinase/response regulator [Jannaschia formosa]|uniref:hybrid sensor histidine kinase/response regulator n=1 Tax=Jannaschia formosa TaxID=2259592 RepID=UPI000E1B6275|nr:PAS-domain containing protein [Jannaschia formosa]TFL16712.1 response regulator [Jannaschia formosa]